MSSIAHRGFVHLGMDVAKDSIAVAMFPPIVTSPRSTRSSTTPTRSAAWSNEWASRRDLGLL